MKEMKTFCGYEIVDVFARTEIEALKLLLKPFMSEVWKIVDRPEVMNVYGSWNVEFTSNDEHFNNISVGYEDYSDPNLAYDGMQVYGIDSWNVTNKGKAYQTIVIEAGQELPIDFVEWLNNNATLKGYQLAFNDHKDDESTTTIDGTWVFKNDITADTSITFEGDFFCNGAMGWSGYGKGIELRAGEHEPGWPYILIDYRWMDIPPDYLTITVYDHENGGWDGALGDCCTITFTETQKVTYEFLQFMKANAIKMITFEVNDIQFSCPEGMTWSEFIGSKYDDSASKNIIFSAYPDGMIEISNSGTGYLANPSGVSGAGGEYVLQTDVIVNGYEYWNMT